MRGCDWWDGSACAVVLSSGAIEVSGDGALVIAAAIGTVVALVVITIFWVTGRQDRTDRLGRLIDSIGHALGAPRSETVDREPESSCDRDDPRSGSDQEEAG